MRKWKRWNKIKNIRNELRGRKKMFRYNKTKLTQHPQLKHTKENTAAKRKFCGFIFVESESIRVNQDEKNDGKVKLPTFQSERGNPSLEDWGTLLFSLSTFFHIRRSPPKINATEGSMKGAGERKKKIASHLQAANRYRMDSTSG